MGLMLGPYYGKCSSLDWVAVSRVLTSDRQPHAYTHITFMGGVLIKTRVIVIDHWPRTSRMPRRSDTPNFRQPAGFTLSGLRFTVMYQLLVISRAMQRRTEIAMDSLGIPGNQMAPNRHA